MKYIFITYDGYPFPIAKMLIDEGNEVIISQIPDNSYLEADSGMNDDEDPETKKRRLSLYDGIIPKVDFDKLIKILPDIKNKDEYFVIFDFNNLYNIAEELLKMGFKNGIFPTKDDFEREKDRSLGKNIVKKHYPEIKVAPVFEFSKTEEAIKFLEENSETIYALKSNGNFASTIVPSTNNPEFAKNKIINALEKDKKSYEDGGFTLEEKIQNPIEIIPEIVFYNGELVYTQIEIESRLFGSGDIGLQTGGAQNIVISTDIDSPINKIAFPPYVYELAKKHTGLFIIDCGLLFDEEGTAYFTEFCGNRWGWGGIFSVLSMSRNGNRVASSYFENVSKGINPFSYKFGTCLSLYNIDPDKKYPGMYKEGGTIEWTDEIKDRLFPYQIKKDREYIINVGFPNQLLGYTTGYGDTFKESVECLYEFEDEFYFEGVYYRSKTDFMTSDHISSLTNRIKYLVDNDLTSDISIVEYPENESFPDFEENKNIFKDEQNPLYKLFPKNK